MPKLIIDTKKTLFDPIEIEVDGEIYTLGDLNTEFFERMEKWEKKALKGNVSANAYLLHEILGMPLEKAKEIDLRKINEIKEFLIEIIYTSKYEKKAAGSGKEEVK